MKQLFEQSIVTHAPLEAAWDAASNLNKAEERFRGIAQIEMLTDGPIGKGTRWRETRIIMRKKATEELELLEWDPPHRYVAGCESCGARYRTTVTCEPVADGTEIRFLMHAEHLTLRAKIMGVVMGVMMRKMMEKCLSEDLEDMKRAAEGSAGADEAQGEAPLAAG